MKFSSLFVLEKQFSFYKQYHSNGINRRIHYVTVPALLITAFAMLTDIPCFYPIPSVAHLVCVLYIIHGLILDVQVGVLHAPVMISYFAFSQAFYSSTNPNAFTTALIIHVFSWIAQIAAHFVFEKRAPALTDSVIQAISSAPVVLWLEIMFSFGFLPGLKYRLRYAPTISRARKAVGTTTASSSATAK